MINPDGSYNRSPFPRNGHPFKEFQKHVAMRMNKDGRPMPFPFIVLGVVGEWGEMDDEVNFGPPEKVIDEAGDVLWYLQACLASKGFSECTLLDLLGTSTRDCKSPSYHYSKLAELAKKEAWHGKEANRGEVLHHLGNLVHAVGRRLKTFGALIEDAMRFNIDKLEKRYPMGFVEGGGIRDVAAVAQNTPLRLVEVDIEGYDKDGFFHD
jgi:NTP pyrophosphatase (non-canonical NTP hydrolase)